MTQLTYTTAGDYTVSLTVTDNDGATNTTTQSVTVVAPPVGLVSDDFGRSVATGWGTAPLGGTWANTGSAANYRVASGFGQQVLTAPGAKRETSLAINTRDIDLTTVVGLDKPATGGGVYVSIGSRRSGTTAYVARLRFFADGSVALHNQRLVSGTATTLNGGTVSGLNYTAGQLLNVRTQVVGNGPTTIRSKVWLAGTTEPTNWTTTSTDSTAALQAPGGIFIEGYLSASSTNAPVVLFVDNIQVMPGA